MADDERTRLARNLKELREARGLTQQDLADAAEVPRPTLAHLESGAGNPTLSVLLKVAAALGIGLSELVAEPRPRVRVIAAQEASVERRNGTEVRSFSAGAGFGFERWELPRGARLERAAGRAGERRFIVCESGELTISVGAEEFRLRPRDIAVVDATCHPHFESRGRGAAVIYSVSG